MHVTKRLISRLSIDKRNIEIKSSNYRESNGDASNLPWYEVEGVDLPARIFMIGPDIVVPHSAL